MVSQFLVKTVFLCILKLNLLSIYTYLCLSRNKAAADHLKELVSSKTTTHNMAHLMFKIES